LDHLVLRVLSAMHESYNSLPR